ncbi:ribbon-helix-helix protein, CopG family [Subtercola lobariae]|uniref:CopG family transcriptional regulator n=1 Tax=Subtercola lobariae TaxID=1588641 RepID=A0A917BCQ3_9MICO|nr:ribbon-helix-helix protein, CopG family [Subtercola lobariae]GGF34377.1 hypothetical protein GCM10011399_29390 [Subtercola lobariae]
MTDTSKYNVTDNDQLVDEDADLDKVIHNWPDGRPMTEENTAQYSEQRKKAGRPSLGESGSSPSVAFRLTAQLRSDADALAAEEGRPVSAIAREALEEYIRRHRAS